MRAAAAVPALLLLLALHSAVEAVPLSSSEPLGVRGDADADAAASLIHRQLQAGQPDKCTEDASYQGWLALVKCVSPARRQAAAARAQSHARTPCLSHAESQPRSLATLSLFRSLSLRD
jgi:hypothetical protein